MKIKHYTTIGFIISLITHIGIFALGGYIMTNLTHEINTKSAQNINDDDITYVDIKISTEETTPLDKENTDVVNKPSDVVVSKDDIKTIPEVKDTKNLQNETTTTNLPPKKEQHFRKLSDLNLSIGKIEKTEYDYDFMKKIDLHQIEDIMSYNPKIKKSVEPVYDHNLIPKDAEIFVVVEYLMNDNGKIIKANIIVSSEDSGVTLPPEVLEDLNVSAIEALKQYEIEPPKDKKGNIIHLPYQEKFKFTH